MMLDPTPDDGELRGAVHAVVSPVIHRAHQRHGPIPAVKTDGWRSAPWLARLAGVLVLGEAYLVADPERAAVDRLKAMAVDLSAELRRERQLIARRQDELGAALRRGDTHQVEALLDRMAGWQWASEDPVVVE